MIETDGTSDVQMQEAPPTVAIIEALEELEQTAATDLPPLYESVYTDALNKVCQSLTDGCVTFEYAGYKITIQDTQDIQIDTT